MRRRRRAFALALLASGLLVAGLMIVRAQLTERTRQTPAREAISSAAQIRMAINGLDLNRARELLRNYPPTQGDAAVLRARLALQQGDCDEARAILGPVANLQTNSGRDLSAIAEGCARAMAAARIVSDEQRGVWVRLQDDADAAWASLVIDAAVRARQFVAMRLGVRTDLPLRIELVMDHASLSALTGLPLKAAETTGTVAVARFGRVTLLSPRSFQKGYPWQDTLAHEITHLLVTAATNDNAPLWLQEGLAKQLEDRWRAPRAHDGVPDHHEIAHTAWIEGRAVGFERLGASIALLPNPEAANIAYAEVFDFLDLVIRESGWNAIKLVLRELRALGPDGADSALRSVTGYSLEQWTKRWRYRLSREQRGPRSLAARQRDSSEDQQVEIARRARLSELFSSAGLHAAVGRTLPAEMLDEYPLAELHALAAASLLTGGLAKEALAALGDADQMVSIQGEWLALRGRALHELGQTAAAREHFGWALAFAPTEVRVACKGYLASEVDRTGEAHTPLCAAAIDQDVSAREPSKP